MRMIRLTLFHLRQSLSTLFFVQLAITSTLAYGLIQRLASQAWGTSPDIGFIRTLAIGLWVCTSTACGILGFERFKGTLIYLVHARIGAFRALISCVIAPALIGICVFPIALIVWLFPGESSLTFTHPRMPLFLCALALFWGTLLIMSASIAALFILTPHALAYEGLLLAPLILLSGIFDNSQATLTIGDYSRFFLPPAAAFRFMSASLSSSVLPAASFLDCALTFLTGAIWIVIAVFLIRRAIHRACIEGNLSLV